MKFAHLNRCMEGIYYPGFGKLVSWMSMGKVFWKTYGYIISTSRFQSEDTDFVDIN